MLTMKGCYIMKQMEKFKIAAKNELEKRSDEAFILFILRFFLSSMVVFGEISLWVVSLLPPFLYFRSMVSFLEYANENGLSMKFIILCLFICAHLAIGITIFFRYLMSQLFQYKQDKDAHRLLRRLDIFNTILISGIFALVLNENYPIIFLSQDNIDALKLVTFMFIPYTITLKLIQFYIVNEKGVLVNKIKSIWTDEKIL